MSNLGLKERLCTYMHRPHFQMSEVLFPTHYNHSASRKVMAISMLNKSLESIVSKKITKHFLSWGTSLTWNIDASNNISLIAVGDGCFVIAWTPSTSGINIIVVGQSSVYHKNATNDQVQFGASSSATTYTLKRNGYTLTLTSANSISMLAIN